MTVRAREMTENRLEYSIFFLVFDLTKQMLLWRFWEGVYEEYILEDKIGADALKRWHSGAGNVAQSFESFDFAMSFILASSYLRLIFTADGRKEKVHRLPRL